MENNRRRWVIAAVGLLLLLTIAVLFVAGSDDLLEIGFAPDRVTPTSEPIVPTRTPASVEDADPLQRETAVPSATMTASPMTVPTLVTEETAQEVAVEATAVPSATVTASPTTVPTVVTEEAAQEAAVEATAVPIVDSELARFGVAIARQMADAEAAYALGLPFGSTQNWNVSVTPPSIPTDYWQMVRIDQEGIRRVNWDTLAEALAANPGSKWLVGNEPDVVWQDNVTPERYAEIYHEVYTFIKEHDPSALVAIGGVSQPTPLRRAYLDIVLDTYQERYGEPMPIDIWNVHAFTLREEADSWGVGIPPGMEGQEGVLYEIEDHDNIDIIAGNLRDFRRWMADRGYGDKPLVISEYGILMPEDYGFPPEDVAAFLTATFDLFREMTGEEGYAPDGDRLVQWWFWYSVNDPDIYSTGNLWDEESGQLTGLGRVWMNYIGENDIAVRTEN